MVLKIAILAEKFA